MAVERLGHSMTDPAEMLSNLSGAPPTPRLDGLGADGFPYIYGWYARPEAVERWIDRSITTVLNDVATQRGWGEPFEPFMVPSQDWLLLYAGLHQGTPRGATNHPSGRRYTAARIHNQVGSDRRVRSLGGDTLPTQLNLWFGGAIDAVRGEGTSLMDRVRDSLQSRTSVRANDELQLVWCQAETEAHPCPGISISCCPGHQEMRLTKPAPPGGLSPVSGARPLMNYEFL